MSFVPVLAASGGIAAAIVLLAFLSTGRPRSGTFIARNPWVLLGTIVLVVSGLATLAGAYLWLSGDCEGGRNTPADCLNIADTTGQLAFYAVFYLSGLLFWVGWPMAILLAIAEWITRAKARRS